jgi:hypothetical protein
MESRNGLRLSSSLAPLVILWLLTAPIMAEQTIYTWTDEQGVVHFADEPPLDAQGVERRVLAVPPAAVRAVPPAESAQTPEAGAPRAEDSDRPAARIVLLSSQTPRLGPSALQVSGEVKNQGGSPASRVAVTVTVLDDTQQNPCLNVDVDVDPPTLEPGKTGKFDAALDNPCLYGDPSVRFEPVWE